MSSSVNIMRITSAIAFVGIFLISIFFFPSNSTAKVYQYTNAAGRTVQSTQPPPGYTNEENPGTTVSRHCREKWDNNFQMLKYCMNKQMEAKRKFYLYPKDIIQFCEDKWPDDFEMIEYCARTQNAAKRSLSRK